jgi:D-alanyl-D-alanine dipeptidase
MLETVAKTLPIKIDCGYRSLTEQYQRFGEQMGIYNDIEEAHKRIAEPSVAGHPTGGAVDIYLEGVSPKVGIFKNCAYNPKNKKQHMLHEAMTKVGFAPYNEEWWHFSYGDKD